ncbi:MAG TPA: oligoendopeptidase F [Herpetosiphon sp.]|uniref:Peptidase M3A and M3B thimet/oligopeptidase F n=1 Tax=Herpetosiphon aurantiacus (strain ATCC 23779 / DSM 785 / 114-95) TaxID=316274 RepID=A9B7T2_HERA2|nr:M3 family oligoendopeptidase [Herpetosiphon sp.]ABX04460.1 peptidase M3A and M3B thimet/oligopeptidase F [Herpetosiphon aurantiacus DSM 785]HBW52287.1 oligoendopeptidase F [Herpetosiphon sp.]
MNTTQSFLVARWIRDDILPTDTETNTYQSYQQTIADLDRCVAQFELLRSSLDKSLSSEAVLQAIRDFETITTFIKRLSGYAELWIAEDTQNPHAQACATLIDIVITKATNKTLFFPLWWKNLPEDVAASILGDIPQYAYWLRQMRSAVIHTLPEPVEQAINLKNSTGVTALRALYDAITSRYSFTLEADGQIHHLTDSGIWGYASHPDPAVRDRAFVELYRVYSQDASLLGRIYFTLVQDWYQEYIELRRYSSPLAVRNQMNDIPDALIETLFRVCRTNTPLFHRYFRLKARWLGMERMRRCDLAAPIITKKQSYTWKQAVEMTLATFESFDPLFYQLAHRIFQANHVDSEVRSGKRRGCWCLDFGPTITPWVQIDFNGRVDDIAALIHEFGHAIHGMLAEHQSVLQYAPSIPLAEVGALFCELLFADHLLQQTHDPEVRIGLRFKQLNDSFAFLHRQIYFTFFECTAHDLIQQGASIDDVAQAYLDTVREEFGDTIDIPDAMRWEWTLIFHLFHYPFYMYSYAFGQLLALALYQQYRQEGNSFKDRFFEILRAGSSDHPVAILSKAGVNIADPLFWQGGYDVIQIMLEDIEQIPIP